MSTWDKIRNEIYSVQNRLKEYQSHPALKYKCLLYIFKWPLRREKKTETNGYAIGYSGGNFFT